ncbi:hypothetical protein D3C76_1713900 [compost metagenome]
MPGPGKANARIAPKQIDVDSLWLAGRDHLRAVQHQGAALHHVGHFIAGVHDGSGLAWGPGQQGKT